MDVLRAVLPERPFFLGLCASLLLNRTLENEIKVFFFLNSNGKGHFFMARVLVRFSSQKKGKHICSKKQPAMMAVSSFV